MRVLWVVMLWLGCAHAPRVDPETQAFLCKRYSVEPFLSPASGTRPAPDDEIVLSHEATWAETPVYTLTVKGDGRVILVVVSGPLVGIEDYTVPPTIAAHLFSEFDALGFSTRPFVTTGDFVTCSPASHLSQRLGSRVTRATRSGQVMVPGDSERLDHLISLVESVARVGEHVALCPPALPARSKLMEQSRSR